MSPLIMVMLSRMTSYMEKGAMSRTTCCEFFGCFRLGMRSGSKSGGKYLFRTENDVSSRPRPALWRKPYLCAQTWLVVVVLCCDSIELQVSATMSAPDSSSLATTTDTKSPDPRTLTNLQDILSCLSLYQSKEAELSISLSASISSSEAITASLSRLQSLQSHLDDLHAEASVLVTTVSSTADTARRVGGRVRSLDEEMRRVREASDRISQVIDLKVSHLPSSPFTV